MDSQTQYTSSGTSAENLETWKGFSKGNKVQFVNPPKDFARFKDCFAKIECIRDSEGRGGAVYFFLTLNDEAKQGLVSDINYTIRKRNPQVAKDNQHPPHMIKVRRGDIKKCDPSLDDLVRAALFVEVQAVQGSAFQTQAVQDPPVESQIVQAQAVEGTRVESQAVEGPAVDETTVQAVPSRAFAFGDLGVRSEKRKLESPPAQAAPPADPPDAVVLPALEKARKKRKLDAPADLPVFESTRTERNLKARLDLTDKMCAQSEMKEAKKRGAPKDKDREKRDLVGKKIKKVFLDPNEEPKLYEGVVTSMSRAKGRDFYSFEGDVTSTVKYRVKYAAVGNELADMEDMSRADVLKYMVH